MATPSRDSGVFLPNNKAIKSVPGLWPSTGRLFAAALVVMGTNSGGCGFGI